MNINWENHQELQEELGLDDNKKEKLEKMVQSYADKVRTDYSQKVKDLEGKVGELEKYKPEELTAEEQKLQEKEKEIFNKEKNLKLQENGLAEFSEFFNVNEIKELDEQINKFEKVLKEKKVESSFKPEDNHKQTDKYSQAKEKGDTMSMIKSLF